MARGSEAVTSKRISELEHQVRSLRSLFMQFLNKISEMNPDKAFVIETEYANAEGRMVPPVLRVQDKIPPKYRHEVTLVRESDNPEPPWQFTYNPLMGFDTKGQKTTRIQ